MVQCNESSKVQTNYFLLPRLRPEDEREFESGVKVGSRAVVVEV